MTKATIDAHENTESNPDLDEDRLHPPYTSGILWSTKLPADTFNARNEFNRLRAISVLAPWSQQETDTAIQAALLSGDIGFLRTAAVLLCQQDAPQSPVLNHALRAVLEEAFRLSPGDAFQIVLQLVHHVGTVRLRLPPVCLLLPGDTGDKIITRNASLPGRQHVQPYQTSWSAFAIEQRFSVEHSRLALHLCTLLPKTGYESEDAFSVLLSMKKNGIDPLADALRFSMPLATMPRRRPEALWPLYSPLEFDFVGDLFNVARISKRKAPAVAAMLLEAAERIAAASPATSESFAVLLGRHLHNALMKLDAWAPGLMNDIAAEFTRKHSASPITPLLLRAPPVRSSSARIRGTTPKHEPEP